MDPKAGGTLETILFRDEEVSLRGDLLRIHSQLRVAKCLLI